MFVINYDLDHGLGHRMTTEVEVMRIYEMWLVKHGKNYNALGEKEKRFADLTNEEYRAMYLGTRMNSKTRSNRLVRKAKSNKYVFRVGDYLPGSVDWREKNVVGAVKDQGQCGLQWGLMDHAFELIINNGGINTEEYYPYLASNNICDANRKNACVVFIDEYEDVPKNNEKSLKKVVGNQPVSIAVEAGGRAFQLYQSGVFTGQCGTNLDHGVVAVGYGTEGGASTGKCGIAMMASYPIKNESNPPKPSPSPLVPIRPPTVCDAYYTCPQGTTCCYLFEYGNYCFGWGCCPMESTTCCDDYYS
ncbi:Detected protein of confused Function [Hibiscus syriacus]|uniref:Detected protein of confused Function n=1 Tax=Hibiscus syriacus TaxID=106335 RepID=A0A6A2XEL1_HIBSY|nr:Detected protein of confused Function [Hibiscus syriacus]